MVPTYHLRFLLGLLVARGLVALAMIHKSPSGLFLSIPSSPELFLTFAGGCFVVEAIVCSLLVTLVRAISKGSEFIVYVLAIVPPGVLLLEAL